MGVGSHRFYLSRWLPALLVATLAGVALLTVASSAPAAVPPTDFLPPVGSTDPFDALTKPTGSPGAYSSSELSQIIRNRIMNPPPVNGLSGRQAAFRASRLYRIQTLLRLRPALSLVTTGIRFVGPAGLLVAGGYVAYKVIVTYTDENGNPATREEWITFDREYLGGAQVTVPSATTYAQGYDWKPCSGGAGTVSPCGSVTDADSRFGWNYLTNLNTSVVASGKAWVFSYKTQFAVGSTAGSCSSNCYPFFFNGSDTANVARTGWLIPTPEYCSGINTASCWGSAQASQGKGGVTGIPTALGLAAYDTINRLEGTLSPLRVRVDRDTVATGHLKAGSPIICAGSVSFVPKCVTAYVPDQTFEALAPDVTTTNPGGQESTTTHPVPSDAGNNTDRGSIPTPGPCTRRIINNLLAPSTYPYPGCADPGEDVENPATPQPMPEPQPVTLRLPPPLLTETATQYFRRLRALGWLGSAHTTTTAEPYPGVGPGWIVAVNGHPIYVSNPSPIPGVGETQTRLPWPNPAPTLSPTEDVTVIQNPTTMEDPLNPGEEIPVPVPDGVGDSTCEPWVDAELDLSPLTELDFGGKFPFGVPGYLGGVLDLFVGGPVAPVFTFDIPLPAVGGYAGGSFEYGPVDLDVLDPYMSVLRTIFAVVLWIAGVWYLGASLIGFRGAGDIGDGFEESGL